MSSLSRCSEVLTGLACLWQLRHSWNFQVGLLWILLEFSIMMALRQHPDITRALVAMQLGVFRSMMTTSLQWFSRRKSAMYTSVLLLLRFIAVWVVFPSVHRLLLLLPVHRALCLSMSRMMKLLLCNCQRLLLRLLPVERWE